MTEAMSAATCDPTEQELAILVAEGCRILGKLDLTRFSLGHVSYRLDDHSMLIKGKGANEVGLRYTEPEDIVKVDFNGNLLSGPDGLSAPSESFIHIWIYKTNPDVRSVVHVHPESAVLLTICGKQIRPIYASYGMGSRIAIEGVPVYPRGIRIDSDELGRELAEFMGGRKCVLMKGHGVSVAGDSIEDSVVRTVTLNELTTMTYKAYLLGDPQEISAEEIEQYSTPYALDRKRGSAGGRAGLLAEYRYWRRLALEGR
jgi:ribulose-5-phosphate 4-epimerase/fuculose-1-phosphate aldolase